MLLPRMENQHLGVVAALALAAREFRFRSVTIAGLHADQSGLADRTAMDLCRRYALTSTLFRFQPGRHEWRQYGPKKKEVYENVSAVVRAVGAERYPVPASSLDRELVVSGNVSSGEIAAETSYASLRATVHELEEESSMLVLSGPPVMKDPDAMVALSLVPRLILAVPADADQSELATVGKLLQSLNVELIGTVLTDYRNPLPRWLDSLLGYR